MAIADAEPKKGEVDVTSTGSSTGVKDMKRPSHGLVKYSSLKDFSFSVSDVWDDLNICIFLECCHANIADLKNYNGSEENKVWEKIAKSGLERAGSISCFNVNYCLELAKCLKSFVSKNESKMMDNDIFKALYDNVTDLLPYFAPVSATLSRKRSESQEKTRMDSKSLHPGNDHSIIMRPFKSPSDSTQALKKIFQILSKYNIEELMKTSTRSSAWKEVSARVENEFGLRVNPKEFLEGYKGSVIATVRTYSPQDPKLKAEVFLKSVGDMLPYFDLVAPKNVKKSDFLDLAEEVTKEMTAPKTESKKRRHDSGEDHDSAEPSAKSSAKLTNSSSLSNPEPVLNRVNPATPLRTYSKKRPDGDADSKSTKKTRSECSSDDGFPRPPDFLDEWATSSVEDATESVIEGKETSARTDPVAKKRGRKPKAQVEGSSSKPVENAKALVPSRHVTRSKRSDSQSSNVPDKVARKPSPARSIPSAPILEENPSARISPSTSSVGNERLSESQALRKDDVVVAAKENPSVIGLTDDTAESDDSEVEDVPLVGTNVTYARHDAKKSKPLSKNMQPVVILKKMEAEELLLAVEGKSSVKRTRGGRQRKTPSRLDPSPVPNTETAVVRRRPGRPPKTPSVVLVKPTTTKPTAVLRPGELSHPTTTSLVRNQPSRSLTAANTGYFSRDLSPRLGSVTVPVSSATVLRSDDYITQPQPEIDPPEWFQRFVVETRRQEMWKMHQFLKMQQELLEAESKKRGVLEKILTALSVRYDRP